MSDPKPKSDAIYVRVTPEQKKAFMKKAAQFEPLSASDVLRELVVGLIEDRVSILPPSDKKESIYVPRIQD